MWPRSVENRAALRTAIATLVAVLISFAFHLETPYWSGMTVIIVANLYTGSIIDKATMRIVGTLAGAFLGFYIAGLVANSFLLYVLSCFVIVSVCVYYYNLSKYGYAYLLGALCAFIVIAQLAVNPHNSFFVAIWRPVEIGIGVLVSAIGAYVIFPNHLKDNMLLQVRDIFADLSLEFKHLFALLQNKYSAEDLAKNNLNIKKKTRKAVELIAALNHEIGVTKEKTDEFRALLNSFYALSRQLQYLIINPPAENDLAVLRELPLEQAFAAIEADLGELQNAFFTQSSMPVTLKTGLAIELLEKQFNEGKKKYSAKSDFIYSFLHFLSQVEANFSLMQSLLIEGTSQTVSKFKLLSREERLRSDYDLVKHSIKAGLSVILALGFWLVSSWPGGLNGIISSLIISIRKNLFEMKNISIHRLLGCMLGGGVALGAMALIELNLFDLVWILFVFVWGFTYFMFKSTKYSYIGLQANIALVISLAQEGGPPVYLAPPLQRLGGIVIGIVASFIVANILWRSDVWTILRRYLGKLYRYMTFNLNQVLLVNDRQKSLHDLANLFWISRGLIEALAMEPLSSRRQGTLNELTHEFESLVVTQATISHILATIDQERAQVTGLQLGVDLVDAERRLVRSYEEHDREGGLKLSRQFNEFIAGIELRPGFDKVEDADLRNILAYLNALNQLALRVV